MFHHDSSGMVRLVIVLIKVPKSFKIVSYNIVITVLIALLILLTLHQFKQMQDLFFTVIALRSNSGRPTAEATHTSLLVLLIRRRRVGLGLLLLILRQDVCCFSHSRCIWRGKKLKTVNCHWVSYLDKIWISWKHINDLWSNRKGT